MKKIILSALAILGLGSLYTSETNAQITIYKDGVKIFSSKETPDYITFEYTPGDGKQHESVDLGLSVEWATTNVGAETEESYGYYYSWGETEPRYTSIEEVQEVVDEEVEEGVWEQKVVDRTVVNFKDKYSTYGYRDYQEYKFTTDSDKRNMNKYTLEDNYKEGIWYDGGTFVGDGKSVLDPEDDAATQNWGSEWRMPTHEEFMELYNNCYWYITGNYSCYVFKAKNEDDKGRHENYMGDYTLSDPHIYLPSAGDIYSNLPAYTGEQCFYWTSTIVETLTPVAFNLGSYGFYPEAQIYGRGCGFTIRPVKK